MKYPKECPVFQVTGVFYNGKIVEGLGIERLEGDDFDSISFRFIDGFVGFGGTDTDGYHPKNLKPLTPAAEEMLAIARERAGQ